MSEKNVSVGDIVEYHGSLSYSHGRYVVEAIEDARQYRPDLMARKGEDFMKDHYGEDMKCYTLWPEGIEVSYRNREFSLNSVRRSSFTPVEDETPGQ